MIYLHFKWGGGYSKSEVDTLLNDYIPRSGGAVLDGTEYLHTVDNSKLVISGGTSSSNAGSIGIYGKDHALYAGYVSLKAQDSNNYSQMVIQPNGTFGFYNNGTTKNVAMAEDVVPRSGGAVINGSLMRNVDNDALHLAGGSEYNRGADIWIFGNAHASKAGVIQIMPYLGTTNSDRYMWLKPDGTLSWSGQPIQYVSDQRFKQQITQIDNALLDAWEDVELVQFKYNDAVEQKGSKARFHTGYVVQQIDTSCKSHNVDISEYGLYCHEEYPEETEEVEVTQEDGTIKKETKVIREASEHYSLRYTETLVVECAYLRRENNRLKERLSKIEKLLNI